MAGGSKEIVLDNKDIEIVKVHISGLVKTKSDYVLEDIKPVFGSKTFLDAYQQSLFCREKLMSRGIFKDVDVVIDTTDGYDSAPDNGVQVVFNVKERNGVVGSISTEMSNTERPRWVARLLSPNLFGRGETLSTDIAHQLNSTTGNHLYQPTDFSATFMKPMRGSNVKLRLLQEKQDCYWSSYGMTIRGGEVGLEGSVRGNTHRLSWVGHWRELLCLNRNTAFDVREQMGQSLKSSIIHSMTVDHVDDVILPMRGGLVKMEEEVAGVGGDVSFIKETMEAKVAATIFDKITFVASLHCGVMVGWRGVSVCDKFFIGGPLTLRGFELNSVGARSAGDYLGSGAFWLSGLHVYTPLPFYWSRFGGGSWLDNFRTHAFVNGGNSFDVNINQSAGANFNAATNNIRLSCGVGLVYKFMNSARIELNFCVPLRNVATDKVVNGLQFGIGVTSV
ncbi:sorting and assembly machinery component 50 homolog A-like [Ciona intestinalis]